MGVKWKSTINKFPQMERAAAELNGKKVSVGVLDGENAWLASIHEYGCTITVTPKMRNYLAATGLHLKKSTKQIIIPERAFLRNGYDENKDDVVSKTEQVVDDVVAGTMSVDQFLTMVGLLLKGKIQDYATALNSPPNHPYTINRKGSSSPLIQSGDMIAGINYKVE